MREDPLSALVVVDIVALLESCPGAAHDSADVEVNDHSTKDPAMPQNRNPRRSMSLVLPILFVSTAVIWAQDSSPPANGKIATPTKNANGRLERVLVFSGTGWFRHPELPASNSWLVRLGAHMACKSTFTPAQRHGNSETQLQISHRDSKDLSPLK
jgi:hypothetical protein